MHKLTYVPPSFKEGWGRQYLKLEYKGFDYQFNSLPYDQPLEEWEDKLGQQWNWIVDNMCCKGYMYYMKSTWTNKAM